MKLDTRKSPVQQRPTRFGLVVLWICLSACLFAKGTAASLLSPLGNSIPSVILLHPDVSRRRRTLEQQLYSLRAGSSDESDASPRENEGGLVVEEEESENEQDDDDSLARAVLLKQQAKQYHDRGDWDQAAEFFHQAADILEESPREDEDAATCRLHEALCRWKNQQYTECQQIADTVLGQDTSAVIRARALHRRSKAKLALDDVEGALQDARSAAFLGDRKAVTLYGRLLRESSSSGHNDDGLGLLPNPDPSLLANLLSKSPDKEAAASQTPASSLSPLASLFGSSATNPLLSSSANSSAGSGGLAKSLLESLSKKIQDESTQDRICQYLQSLNTPQLQQMATMAGVPLKENQLEQIVRVSNGITPQIIRKYIRITKRTLYSVSLLRKCHKLLQKYRSLLIWIFLLAWIRNAITKPIPINKKALKQAMRASK